MIFEAQQSELFRFNFHSMSSKTLKFPEFNLGMDELGNKIEDKIYFIQEEIKKLSRYNSRLIPSSFQANKVMDLKS